MARTASSVTAKLTIVRFGSIPAVHDPISPTTAIECKADVRFGQKPNSHWQLPANSGPVVGAEQLFWILVIPSVYPTSPRSIRLLYPNLKPSALATAYLAV